MLVLTCKVDDAIKIGDEVTLHVVKVTKVDGVVALGVAAPRRIPVDRKEVADAKKLHPEGKPDANG